MATGCGNNHSGRASSATARLYSRRCSRGHPPASPISPKLFGACSETARKPYTADEPNRPCRRSSSSCARSSCGLASNKSASLRRRARNRRSSPPQSHGRNRQRAALQPILDEMQQSISIAQSGRASRSFRRWAAGAGAQASSRLAISAWRFSSSAQSSWRLLDRLDENCVVDAFLAELGNRGSRPAAL